MTRVSSPVSICKGGRRLKVRRKAKENKSSLTQGTLDYFVILWSNWLCTFEFVFCFGCNLGLFVFSNSFSLGILYYGVVLMTTQVFQQIRPGQSLCSSGRENICQILAILIARHSDQNGESLVKITVTVAGTLHDFCNHHNRHIKLSSLSMARNTSSKETALEL